VASDAVHPSLLLRLALLGPGHLAGRVRCVMHSWTVVPGRVLEEVGGGC